MKKEPPYNPLDKTNLGISVAEALLERPINALPPDEKFYGAGIYALYYTGPFEPYRTISSLNNSTAGSSPIYVGRAVPKGSRKGGQAIDSSRSTALYNRLVQHSQSISSADNLELSDFACRYLVVDDVWISLGESLLIDMFSPVWNLVLDGFGNKTPGKNRKQKRSTWDVIHPGRPWVESIGLLPHKKNQETLLEEIAAHSAKFSGTP